MSNRNYVRILLILVIVASFVFRLWIAVHSLGTNDILLNYSHAMSYEHDGIPGTYHRGSVANHPPFVFYILFLVLEVSRILDVSFALSLKLLTILADCLSTYLIVTILGKKELAGRGSKDFALGIGALFAINPISILQSSYHGNFDSLYAALVLLAVVFFYSKRFLLAGTILGLSINLKLIPFLIVPGLILLAEKEGKLKSFLIGLIPWSVPFVLLYVVGGTGPLKQTVGYNPMLNHWGIQSILLLLHRKIAPSLSEFVPSSIMLYRSLGGLVVIGSVISAGLFVVRRKNGNVWDLLTLVFLLFLIFTPGFGLQYLTILPVVLFARSPGWGVMISLLGGLVCFLSYWSSLSISEGVFSSINPAIRGINIWISLLTWGSLVAYVLANFGFRGLLERSGTERLL